MQITVCAKPFDPWRELQRHQAELSPGAVGACASFVGTMRDFNDGATVHKMTLEHYPEMTERQLTLLTEQAIARNELTDALIIHRIGEIHPNDAIVLVAAWSPHRANAFAGCRELIEHLKTRAPFWKCETGEGGERWVAGNTPCE